MAIAILWRVPNTSKSDSLGLSLWLSGSPLWEWAIKHAIPNKVYFLCINNNEFYNSNNSKQLELVITLFSNLILTDKHIDQSELCNNHDNSEFGGFHVYKTTRHYYCGIEAETQTRNNKLF